MGFIATSANNYFAGQIRRFSLNFNLDNERIVPEFDKRLVTYLPYSSGADANVGEISAGDISNPPVNAISQFNNFSFPFCQL
jgi:hypothetical protein